MEATPHGPIRVLIIDSDPQVGRALVRLLKLANDIEVIARATDAGTALAFAVRFQPTVAVVDVGAAQMDGMAITRTLRQQAPATQVVGVSVYATFRDQALAAGVCRFLLKDAGREELVVAIRLAARRQCQAKDEETAAQVALQDEQPSGFVRSTPLPAPRLYFLTAQEAPIVVVLRRGPSARYHVIKINTQTGVLETGSWFTGSLYGNACDLSFNGEWLVYKALGAGGAVWTGLCRPPWLKTYREWENAGTRNGGGFFASRTVLQIHVWSQMKVTQSAPLPFTCREDGIEHDAAGKIVIPDYLALRLRRDGWRPVAPTQSGAPPVKPAERFFTDQREWVCQPTAEHPPLRMLSRPVVGGKRARFALDHPAALIDKMVDWANWDAFGNLLVARQGLLQKYTLADLTSGQPSHSWDLRTMPPA